MARLPDIAMEPSVHECDLPGFRRVKVRDSAVFRVPHILFQQRSASTICNYKTAETVWRHEAEHAKLTRDFHWHWRRIPFRIRSGPNPAQPVEIPRRQIRMRGPPHFRTGRMCSSEPFPATTMQPLPACLAAYIAVSAAVSKASALIPCAGIRAMPMLAPT